MKTEDGRIELPETGPECFLVCRDYGSQDAGLVEPFLVFIDGEEARRFAVMANAPYGSSPQWTVKPAQFATMPLAKGLPVGDCST